MKKMICNMITIAAALAFVMVMGAAIEGTIGLAKAAMLLAAFGAAAYKAYAMGEAPAKAAHTKKAIPSSGNRTGMVQAQQKRTMKAA